MKRSRSSLSSRLPLYVCVLWYAVVVQSAETSVQTWKNDRVIPPPPPPPPQGSNGPLVDDDLIEDATKSAILESNRTRILPPPPPPPRSTESSSLQQSSATTNLEAPKQVDSRIREEPSTEQVVPLPFEEEPQPLPMVPPPPPRAKRVEDIRSDHSIPWTTRKEEVEEQSSSFKATVDTLPESSALPPREFSPQHAALPLDDQWSEDPSSMEHRRRMLLARLQEQDRLRRSVVPPTRRATPTPRTPQLWKSLWRTVEGGLDQLVHLEDAVTDRAQQWYAITVQKKDAVISSSSPLWSSRRAFSRKRSYSTQEPVEQLDLSRFQKKTTVQQKDSTGISAVESPTSSSIIAVANGGASAHPSPEHEAARVRPGPPLPSEVASRYAPYPQQQQQQQKPSDPMSSLGGTNAYGSSMPQLATKPTSERLLPVTTEQTRSARWPGPSSFSGDSTMMDTKTYVPPVQQQTSSQEVKKTTALRFDDDDDDDMSLLDRLKHIIPPLPNLRSVWRNRKTSVGDLATLDAWNSIELNSTPQDRRGFWRWFPSAKSNDMLGKKSSDREESKELLHTEPMEDLTSRFRNGKMSSLLNLQEEALCQEIGRGKAFWDLVSLIFMVAAVREFATLTVNFQLPTSFVEALTTTVTDVLSILAASTETWIPIVLVAAFLSSETKYLLCERKENALIESVESSIREESQYGSLFLRLVASIPVQRSLPDKMACATIAQIATKVGLVHLQTIVMGILTAFFLVLISSLRLLVMEIFGAFHYALVNRQQVASLSGLQLVIEPLRASLSKLIHESVLGIIHNPLLFIYMATLLVSFVSVSLLPLAAERSRWTNWDEDDSERTHDEAEKELQIHFTEQLSQLGASSASRLDLCSTEGRIDYFLQRWCGMMQPYRPKDAMAYRDGSWIKSARIVGFCTVSTLILLAPLLILLRNAVACSFCGVSWLPLRLDSLLDCAAACFLTQHIVWSVLKNTLAAREWKERVSGFISQLNTAISERQQWLNSAPSNGSIRTPHQPYIVPTAGITVSDLWSSHATKRAWAVRGASFSCRNGEVVALLGDDGAGKTRLLTTVAEAILSPPKSASTTQKVRGTITVGGLDVAKWNDNRQLRKHVGISLSDVRYVSDTAQILSGLSLEDILDPNSGRSVVNPSSSKLGKVAMTLALRITGMDSALLQRLPSKLSTVVTANEDELLHAASLLRPRFLQILSLAEWSKLLLTRTIARAIYENDHGQSDPSTVSNALVGSVLFLDDVTLHMSEVEEARLLNDLRRTGAATIFSSHRWVSGRFADHIIVMKDGTIVEAGTHAELINRGPQYSLYAAKWYAITNS